VKDLEMDLANKCMEQVGKRDKFLAKQNSVV